MLKVRLPDWCYRQARYAADVVFRQFLGLEVHLCPHRGEVQICDDNGCSLAIRSEFFCRIREEGWLQSSSLPKLPLERVHQQAESGLACVTMLPLPILYGGFVEGTRLLFKQESSGSFVLGVDVLGSVFFLLTRYEETLSRQRDSRGRFSVEQSIASKEGFVERPLADEYVDLLWAALIKVWPRLRRKNREYRVTVTHDVDWPFVGYRCPWSFVLRGCAADILRSKSPITAFYRVAAKLARNGRIDPANTFDEIMTISETAGLRSEFNFIAGGTAGIIDGVYSLSDYEIRLIMLEIHRRGHVIGFHPSYNSFDDAERIRYEYANLRTAAQSLGVVQPEWGGRQHFLRWRNPATWQNWEDAGLQYDSTLGFADAVGFRCGTCHEYTTFNLLTCSDMKLIERPLIAMDITLIGKNYMALTNAAVIETVVRLKERVSAVSGNFVVLWHNSQLLTRVQRGLYRRVVNALIHDTR